MTKLTKESSIKLAAELTAAGVKAYAKHHDGCMPDNTIQMFFSVAATLRDEKTGNAAVRTLRVESDAAEVAKDMKKEIKALAKATRERIATERFLNRS